MFKRFKLTVNTHIVAVIEEILHNLFIYSQHKVKLVKSKAVGSLQWPVRRDQRFTGLDLPGIGRLGDP